MKCFAKKGLAALVALVIALPGISALAYYDAADADYDACDAYDEAYDTYDACEGYADIAQAAFVPAAGTLASIEAGVRVAFGGRLWDVVGTDDGVATMLLAYGQPYQTMSFGLRSAIGPVLQAAMDLEFAALPAWEQALAVNGFNPLYRCDARALDARLRQFTSDWWLAPRAFAFPDVHAHSVAAYVMRAGHIQGMGWATHVSRGIRPAMGLRLDWIAFGLQNADAQQLFAQNAALAVDVPDLRQVGAQLVIDYAAYGEYILAVLADDSGIRYAAAVRISAAGSGQAGICVAAVAEGDYTLKLLALQPFGANHVSFVSTPVLRNVTIVAYVPPADDADEDEGEYDDEYDGEYDDEPEDEHDDAHDDEEAGDEYADADDAAEYEE